MARKSAQDGKIGDRAQPESATAETVPAPANGRPITLDGLQAVDLSTMPTAQLAAKADAETTEVQAPAPTEVEDCCANCRFYRGAPKTGYKFGTCQEDSPNPVANRFVLMQQPNPMQPNEPPATVMIAQQVDGYFPLTTSTRWCGKHKLTTKPWRELEADSQTVGGRQ